VKVTVGSGNTESDHRGKVTHPPEKIKRVEKTDERELGWVKRLEKENSKGEYPIRKKGKKDWLESVSKVTGDPLIE